MITVESVDRNYVGEQNIKSSSWGKMNDSVIVYKMIRGDQPVL